MKMIMMTWMLIVMIRVRFNHLLKKVKSNVRDCLREIPEPHHKDRKVNPVWNHYKKSIKIDSTGMIKTLFVNSWLVVLFVVIGWQCLKLQQPVPAKEESIVVHGSP